MLGQAPATTPEPNTGLRPRQNAPWVRPLGGCYPGFLVRNVARVPGLAALPRPMARCTTSKRWVAASSWHPDTNNVALPALQKFPIPKDHKTQRCLPAMRGTERQRRPPPRVSWRWASRS